MNVWFEFKTRHDNEFRPAAGPINIIIHPAKEQPTVPELFHRLISKAFGNAFEARILRIEGQQ